MVEVCSGTKTRRQGGQDCRLCLVRFPMAQTAKEAVLLVENIIDADIKIVPVLDLIHRVLLVVDDRAAARVLRKSAVWLREGVQIRLSHAIDPIRRDNVGL